MFSQLMQVQQEHSGPQTDTQRDELLQQVIGDRHTLLIWSTCDADDHGFYGVALSQMQQLREELDAVHQEKNQLTSDLQENVEMVRC